MHVLLMHETIKVTLHTCVLAAQSALPCLVRGIPILCASTHCTPPVWEREKLH